MSPIIPCPYYSVFYSSIVLNPSDSSLQASITWDLLTSSIHHFLMKENVYQAVRWERELILQFGLKEYHSECIEYCLLSLKHDIPKIVKQSQQVVSMLMDVKEVVENYSLLASLLPVFSYFIVCFVCWVCND